MPNPVVVIENDSQSVTYCESPPFNPTGVQFVTKSMLGTTSEEHRILIHVETVPCSGTVYGSYFWDAASVSESDYELKFCVSIALAFCRGVTARLFIHD